MSSEHLDKAVTGCPCPSTSITPARSHAFILGIDSDGHVTHNLQQPNSGFDATTSAVRHGNTLYIGSLGTDAIGVLDLP